MAAEAGLAGLDALAVLREPNPTDLMIWSAVIEKANKIRERDMKQQARMIANQVGKMLGG